MKVAPQPPVITGQPRTKTVDYGLSALFGVTATGTGTVNYQWRKNGINIPGATAPNHVISAVARADEGGYSAVVWNSGGSVTSVVATLTVRVTGTPPSITGQPRNKAVELGQATLFGVTASGTEPLRYQWQKDGVDIPGATGPTYHLPVVARSHAGVYQAVVTNPAGEARSLPAWLVVRFPGLGQRVDRVGVGPDGTLTVDLPVEPGVEYELLESPDLRSWTVRERFQATAPVMRRNVGRPSAGSGFLGLRPRGP
ncbi:MAG: immunoglobulin domain-containing protein [Verrucomicrobiota bacterium]